MKNLPLALGPALALSMAGLLVAPERAEAAECVKTALGGISVNNGSNPGGCVVTSIAPDIGDGSPWGVGILVNSSHNTSRTLTVESDLTTTMRGSTGINVDGGNPAYTSTFDASGKTINLTMETTTANSGKPEGDNQVKMGLQVNQGSTAKIGTLNLTMLNLPSRGQFEHYGVLAGSPRVRTH